ncbi:DMT family transporter [Sphingobacterium sp. UT-1RO-CII-1]|uniref:DMT family transporter n=1 Tax=Sphingobacterium sp. UT-1RO-CII-1 TaxID=2995225 RepID=UPI00227C00F0|nr:DMT family transporter [Sphingobacterium sp. UT-1RO-CII-1]MCY4780092.1 DMT family transporter [Sphingobacterium sp. UT-1RO-CII-1]
MNKDKIKGIIAVFLGAASFGILSTFVKKAYAEGFSLGEITGIQALFGMLILWFILTTIYLFNKSYFHSFKSNTPKWHILLSGIATGSVSILYYKSVQLIPASLAIVLLMQYIWIGQLIEFLLFKQRPTKKQSICIFIILLSTLLATGMFEQDLKDVNILGVLYGIFAATAYSIFLLVSGRVGNDHPPLQKSAFMVSGAFIFIFILLQPITLFQPDTLSSLWKYGLLLSVFGTVLPPVLFTYGIPKTGVSLAGILSSVELPVAVCMSYLVLKEPVSQIQFIGVLAIIIVVIILNLNRKKDTTSAQ